jgi:glycosyltransferase involved in cell wall biosynthesis
VTRIFGWSADSSGCEWYRIRVPLKALEQAYGYDVMTGQKLPDAQVLTAMGSEPLWRPDVLIGQRVVNPGPSALWQALAGAQGLPVNSYDVPEWAYAVLRGDAERPRLVFELDDDLWNVDPSNTRAYQFFSDMKIIANMDRNLLVADAVTVTTEPLAAQVRQHTDAPVFVVPNYLPDWLPVPIDEIEYRAQQGRDSDIWGPLPPSRTVIGWAGSNTHRNDVAECSSAVKRFIDRSPMTELYTIGAPWPGIMTSQQRHSEWANSVPDFYRLLDFDIGLAPLRPSVFNRSKSAIKVMEYGALGIVPVASNVGPYADYIRSGYDGVLVDRPHEWSGALRALTEYSKVRAEMARAAWEKAKDNTIGKHVHEWKAVIDAVTK